MSGSEQDDDAVMREILDGRGPHLRTRGPAVNRDDGFTLPDAHVSNADAVAIEELIGCGDREKDVHIRAGPLAGRVRGAPERT